MPSSSSPQITPEMLAQLMAQYPELAKEPGMLSNAWKEIEGFKYLPAAAVMLPGMVWRQGLAKTAHDVIYEPLKQYYVSGPESYRHPLTHIKKYPIGSLLDAITIASLGSGALLKGAEMAGVSGRALGTLSKVARGAAIVNKAATPSEWIKAGLNIPVKSYRGAMAAGKMVEEMSPMERIGNRIATTQSNLNAWKHQAYGKVEMHTTATKRIAAYKKGLGKIYDKLTPQEQGDLATYWSTPHIEQMADPQVRALVARVKTGRSLLKDAEFAQRKLSNELAEQAFPSAGKTGIDLVENTRMKEAAKMQHFARKEVMDELMERRRGEVAGKFYGEFQFKNAVDKIGKLEGRIGNIEKRKSAIVDWNAELHGSLERELQAIDAEIMQLEAEFKQGFAEAARPVASAYPEGVNFESPAEYEKTKTFASKEQGLFGKSQRASGRFAGKVERSGHVLEHLDQTKGRLQSFIDKLESGKTYEELTEAGKLRLQNLDLKMHQMADEAFDPQKVFYQEYTKNPQAIEKMVKAKIEGYMVKGPSENLVYHYMGHADNPFVENLGSWSDAAKPGFKKKIVAPGGNPVDFNRQNITRMLMEVQSKAKRETWDRYLNSELEAGRALPWRMGMKIRPDQVIVAPTFERRAAQAASRAYQMIGDEHFARQIAEKGLTVDELIKVMENKVDPDVIMGIFHDLLPKDIHAAKTDVKMAMMQKMLEQEAYVVPKSSAKIMLGQANGAFSPFMRMMWDTPNELWRWAVLSGSPRWLLYNTVGNIMFSLLHGTRLKSYLKAASGKYDELMPGNVTGGTFSGSEAGPMSRTGLRVIDETFGKPRPTAEYTGPIFGKQQIGLPEQIGLVGKGLAVSKKGLSILRDANEKVEQFFRKAMYIDEATKTAEKAIIKEHGFQLVKANDLIENKLQEILRDPDQAVKIVDHLGDYLFNYWNLTPFEKNVMRRVFPFWSWTRNMTKLTTWTLPFKHPAKFKALTLLAEIGKEAWQQTLKEKGIDLNQLPEWVKGSIPVGYNQDTKEITWWSTIGINPFTTTTEMSMRQLLSGLDPKLKIIIERAIKEDLFRGKKFDSIFVYKDPMGGLWELDPERPGRMKRSEGKAPPLIEHILRQFPQYILVKQWLLNRKYGNIPREFAESKAWDLKPMEQGKGLKVPFGIKWPAIFGMPMSKMKLGSPVEVKMEKSVQGKVYKQVKGLP